MTTPATDKRLGLCPRCGNTYLKYGKAISWNHGDPPFAALSRRDNKTLVCSACGEAEAFEDIGWSKWTGPCYWKAAS